MSDFIYKVFCWLLDKLCLTPESYYKEMEEQQRIHDENERKYRESHPEEKK